MPLVEDGLARGEGAGADQADLAGFGHALQQDIAALPAGAAGVRAERLAALDDLRREEVLRHDDQVGDRQPGAVIGHQHKARVVGLGQPLGHRSPGAVDHLAAEAAVLALEFVFLGQAVQMKSHTRRLAVCVSTGAAPQLGQNG